MIPSCERAEPRLLGTARGASGLLVALLTPPVLLAPGAPPRGGVHQQPDDDNRYDDAHHPQEEFPGVSCQHLPLLILYTLTAYTLTRKHARAGRRLIEAAVSALAVHPHGM
jgi:hypothetical protein